MHSKNKKMYRSIETKFEIRAYLYKGTFRSARGLENLTKYRYRLGREKIPN